MLVWVCMVMGLLTGGVEAQVWDDFNDGDFSQGVQWAGDTAQFIVDNGELRLFSSGSDSSSLATLFLSGADTLEWRFRLRMPFAPSSQNYVRFYLWSDVLNLEGPVNGYYLQFGETGAADAFELRYQSGWSSSVLLRGPDSLIANGTDIRLKVVRFPGGFWQVAYDPGGGEQFVLSGTAFHGTLPVNAFVGLKCVYTSSNSQRCYLDDVYAGPYVVDFKPPELVSVQFIAATGLGLTWNEPLDALFAMDTTRYVISPFGHPDSVLPLSADGRGIALYFSGAFADTVSYELWIHGVKDESGNTLSDTLKWPVFKVFPVQPGEVVFSEIMADPSGAPLLPNFEYVEVYNRSSRVVSLSGCMLHDASSSCSLPPDTLKPGEFLFFSSALATASFHNAGLYRVRGLSAFPSLNNDGDSLRLTGPGDFLIDAIDYDKGMYLDPLRDDQGWSLERIDVHSPCSNRQNWKASIDPRGGTPGMLNSESGVFKDTVAPWPIHAYPSDSITTLLYFSEWPDTTLAKETNWYRLEPVGWVAASVKTGVGKPHLILGWPQPLSPDVRYELVIDYKLSDCTGNTIRRRDRVQLGLPVSPSHGDVIINEVLFNPMGEDGDFVELVNRSVHPVNLGDLRLAHADPADGIIRNAVKLKTEQRLLMPFEYVVAAVEPERITERYPRHGMGNLVNADLSGYDDDEGTVVLLDASLQVLDRFHYSDDFHFPLLADPEGVSLERITSTGDSDDRHIWHSASAQCGYATPGVQNSQLIETAYEGDDWLRMEPRLFSPDNDGHHDVLLIKADLPKSGFMATLNVYNEQGLPVRQIATNDYLSPDAMWTWNGTGDDGGLMPPGPYIIAARFTHIDGEVRLIRKICVLAPPRTYD